MKEGWQEREFEAPGWCACPSGRPRAKCGTLAWGDQGLRGIQSRRKLLLGRFRRPGRRDPGEPQLGGGAALEKLQRQGTHSSMAIYFLCFKGRKASPLQLGDPFLFRSTSKFSRSWPKPRARSPAPDAAGLTPEEATLGVPSSASLRPTGALVVVALGVSGCDTPLATSSRRLSGGSPEQR